MTAVVAEGKQQIIYNMQLTVFLKIGTIDLVKVVKVGVYFLEISSDCDN